MKAGFEYLKSKGAILDQPNTNGLHVHISSKFFEYGLKDSDYTAVENAYMNMDWLFQFFQTEIEKIGGREYTSYCQSKIAKIKSDYNIGRSNRNNKYNAEFELKGKMGKSPMSSGDHYSAITMSGRTIEGRVFNSSIDYKQVLACIEMMRNMAHAVRGGEVVGKTLGEILATKESPYLDEVVAKLEKKYKKDTAEFNLDKVCEAEMEIK